MMKYRSQLVKINLQGCFHMD